MKPDEARCPTCGSGIAAGAYGPYTCGNSWHSWHDNAVEMAGGGAARQRPNAPEPEPAKSAVHQPVSTDAALREAVEKAMHAKAWDIGGANQSEPDLMVPLDEAASVAVEMVQREREEGLGHYAALQKHTEAAEKERDEARKALAEYRERWGHWPNCGCLIAGLRFVRDPRCAPPEGRKRKT